MDLVKPVLLLGFLTIVMVLLFIYNVLTLSRTFGEEERKKRLKNVITFSLLTILFSLSMLVISFSSGNTPDNHENTVKSDTNLK